MIKSYLDFLYQKRADVLAEIKSFKEAMKNPIPMPCSKCGKDYTVWRGKQFL